MNNLPKEILHIIYYYKVVFDFFEDIKPENHIDELNKFFWLRKHLKDIRALGDPEFSAN